MDGLLAGGWALAEKMFNAQFSMFNAFRTIEQGIKNLELPP
jgi:hypothetical protein